MLRSIVSTMISVPLMLSSALAQSAAGPAFEVASVKVSAPADQPVVMMRGGPGTSSPGQITYTNATVRMLVAKAWDLKPYQLAGPDSMDRARFDLAAKIPPSTSQAEFLQMLRRLLTERIGLKVHHESKEMGVFEMSIAKDGLKMKIAEAAPEVAAPAGKIQVDKNDFPLLPPGKPASMESGGFVFHISVRMDGLPELLALMERHGGRPVIDRTGLTGKYDFTLAFSRESSALFSEFAGTVASGAGKKGPSAEPIQEASKPAATFLQAVELQLGLKLQPSKAPIDVVFVDSFDKIALEN